MYMKLYITVHILYIYFIKKEWETHRATEKKREITKAGKVKPYRAKNPAEGQQAGELSLTRRGWVLFYSGLQGTTIIPKFVFYLKEPSNLLSCYFDFMKIASLRKPIISSEILCKLTSNFHHHCLSWSPNWMTCVQSKGSPRRIQGLYTF